MPVRNHSHELLLLLSGYGFLRRGLRLDLRDVVPRSVLARSCARVHIAIANLKIRVPTQLGEEHANLRSHLRRGHGALNVVPDLFESGLPGRVTLFHLKNQVARGTGQLDRVRDVTPVVRENHVRHFRAQILALQRRSQIAAVLGRLRVVRVGRSQVGEFLAGPRPPNQVLRLNQRGRVLLLALAVRGKQNLAQKYLFLANVILLMILVVLPHRFIGDEDLPANLFGDHPLRQERVPQLLLVLFERHAVLLADPIAELIRVADSGLHLQPGDFPCGVRIHADVEVLGPLDQQKLVDLVAQRVGHLLVEGLSQLSRTGALLPELVGRFHAKLVQVALGDDVAVHFGGDFLHYPDVRYVRRGGHRNRCRNEYCKPANHKTILPVYQHPGHGAAKSRLCRRGPALRFQLLQLFGDVPQYRGRPRLPFERQKQHSRRRELRTPSLANQAHQTPRIHPRLRVELDA